MELQIVGRNLKLSDQIRSDISRKFNRLSRHLPNITSAKVELVEGNAKAQDQRIVAQATLDIDGTVLRGEERGASATAAVDSVIQVMDRRIERYKGKVYRSKKTGKVVSLSSVEAADAVVEEEPADEELEAVDGKVVRMKRFPIKPMTLNEAAFQMELLGHNFFLFLNSETDQYSLLYSRRDGDYGLIQPEPL